MTDSPRPVRAPHAAAHPDAVLVAVDVPSTPLDAWPEVRAQLAESKALHTDELALADTLPPPRRPLFVAGRLAMRTALRTTLPDARDADVLPPVLRTARGAPLLPDAVTGSITHKGSRALAALQRLSPTVTHLGVDLERRPRDANATDIAARILTDRERDALANYARAIGQAHAPHDVARLVRERTLVHFALKEAVYKAIDPVVQRYVRFTEVALTVQDEGAVLVTLAVPELLDTTWHVDAWWHLDDEWIVATAVSRR